MSDRKPRRKLRRKEISRRIQEAIEDVRQNGRAGRTISEMARQYGCSPSTLQTRLSEAGLTTPLEAILAERKNRAANPSNLEPIQPIAAHHKAETVAALNPADPVAAIPEILPQTVSGNFLTTSKEGQNCSNLAGMKGDGGELLKPEQLAESFGKEVRARIEDAVRLAGLIEIKSAGDLEKLVRTYRETLRPLDGGASIGSGTLIQVNVLGDSSAPAPRIVKPISESPSNSPD